MTGRRLRRTIGVLAGVLVGGSVIAAATAAVVPAPADAAADDPDGAYLHAVTELFLGRSATADEVDRWRPSLELGARSGLTDALSTSVEWAAVQVDALFRQVLGRPASPAELDRWVAEIGEGTRLEEVAAHLYGGAEYYDRAGTTVGDFVQRLYQDLLRRSPEPAGERYWTDQLDAGMPRWSVAGGFYASLESRRSRVDRLYRQVLGRAPEPEGRDFWADTILGIGDVNLAAHLAASAEHYQRTTGTTAVPAPDRGVGTGYSTYATAGGLTLRLPAALMELTGFHQSGHDGSIQQDAVRGPIPSLVMSTRYRGTGSRTASDLVVAPDIDIRSPVTGTVLQAETYALYCRYSDDRLIVEPDDRPGWRVAILHVSGLQVGVGDRVVAGETVIAPAATVLPFDSQVDDHTAEPSWPHVHVEVFDPSVPDRPSGEC